jgi:uncharacterized protein YxeA
MTAKEKAKELVEKYFYLFSLELENTIADYEAKQCALIAVDEILKEYGTYYKVEVNGKYVSYWQEVKKEIEKL